MTIWLGPASICTIQTYRMDDSGLCSIRQGNHLIGPGVYLYDGDGAVRVVDGLHHGARVLLLHRHTRLRLLLQCVLLALNTENQQRKFI